MPWIGKDALIALNRIADEHIELRIKAAKLETALAAEVDRRDRAELDLSRLQDDYKRVISETVGRIPPKLSPEFDKDIFAEDTSRPETFLTPHPDEIGIDAEAILRDINASDEDLSG